MSCLKNDSNKFQTSIIVDQIQYPNSTTDIVNLIPETFDIYVLKFNSNVLEIIIYNC